MSVLLEAKNCPKCDHIMYWWEKDGKREWRCENCDYREDARTGFLAEG